MDIFGEDASTLIWKYGGMTSAALGAITTLTLIVLNALSDGESRRRYEHPHGDEDSKNHHGAIGNDDRRPSQSSSTSSDNNATNGDDMKRDLDDNEVVDDVDWEFDRGKRNHYEQSNGSEVGSTNRLNKRSSKKKLYSK
nr:uncharacterized protein LOC129260604 [Lytechinus pictus]